MHHQSFAEISAGYPTIFFDAFGVLKAASGIIEGVPDMLLGLRRQGKQLFVLTNDASRSPAEMAVPYQHPAYGQLITPEQVISSGTLTTEFLRDKVRSGTAAYLGKASAAHFITEAGLRAMPIRDCRADDPDLSAIVLLDDEGFDWFEDINLTINLARKCTVPLVVANADLSYPVSGNEVAVAVGSLASMMQKILRKSFIRFGKPNAMMFSYAYDRARAERPNLRKQDVLMVGDTLHTDIIGANKFGIDTALVLTGNTLPGRAATMIEASGVIPNYVCHSVLT